MGVLKVRVNDAWETIGGGDSEVLVSDVDPYVIDPDATEELWYSPMVKQMFVRVNNSWQIATPNEVMVSRADPAPINPDVELWYDVDASPGPGAPKPPAIDEVWVGDTEPIKPTIELWYDTSTDPGVLKARVNSAWVSAAVPPGGVINTALVKVSAADGDVRWGGQLDVHGTLGMGNASKIQFQNETGDKINLYSADFGLGINNGETVVYGGTKVGFRDKGWDGTLWATVDASGVVSEGNVMARGGHLQSTGGAGVYADAANDTNGTWWEVTRARNASARLLWHLNAVHGAVYGAGAEGRFELWAGNGYEASRKTMWTDYEANINCYFDGAVTSQQILVRSAPSTGPTPTALNGSVGAVIDALRPITFTRPVPASDSDKPAAPPIVEVGFDVADVAATGIAGLVVGDGDEAAYSLNGLLAIAIAEIKSLRAWRADIEARIDTLGGN